MDNRTSELIESVPALSNVEFQNTEELIDKIIDNNQLLWGTIKFLIFKKLVAYFKETSNLQISKEEIIYNTKYLGTSNYLIKDISEHLNLTLPKMGMPKSVLLTQLGIIFSWTIVVFYFLISFPELLLFGSELLIMNALVIILLPIVVLHFIAPKWLNKKKYDNVKTFDELTGLLFTVNLYKYRLEDFKRLKVELKDYLQAL